MPLRAQSARALEIIKQQTNTAKLQELALKWEQRDSRRYREAVAAARRNDWPIRIEEEKRIIEIYALDEDGNPLYRTTYNDDAAVSTQTDQLHSGGGSGLNLEGKNMTIGEWDGGATRSTHENLSPRVTQQDGATTLSSHATHVAGTLIGDGVPSSSAKGMAPQADLDAYDWNSDDSEMASAASNGLLISNHSYGFITGWNFSSGNWRWWGNFSSSTQEDDDFGQYSGSARGWDVIANNAPFYLIVKAAGNDRGDGPPNVGGSFTNSGTTYTYNPALNPNRSPAQDGGSTGYDCISAMGIAKNVLTVGAVNDVNNYSGSGSVSMSSFSGWGPTDDGRIKPDICGNGVGLYSSTASANNSYSSFSGTSMASPNVAGSLLLLQEHYMNIHNDTAMRAATLKALAIHTAREAGSATGPDYQYGWGLLSTADAADVISRDTINRDVIRELSLANNATFTFQFKALGTEPIRATIAWNDPAGISNNSFDDTTPVLVNDLDLRISDSAATFKPYRLNPAAPASAATTGDNRVDNVEQVYIANPVAGRTYTLTVNHKATLNSTQRFGLIISGQQLASCPRPGNLQATNLTDTSAILRWTSNATQWQVAIATAGTPLPQAGLRLVNSKPYLAGGLHGGTDYDWYVRSICGSGDTSLWTAGTPFRTLCSNVITAPQSYDFESTTRNGATFTNCWKRSSSTNPAWFINQGSTPSNSTGPFADNTLKNAAGHYLYLETSAPSGAGDTSSFVSPQYDVSALTDPYLGFYYHMYGATMGTLELFISSDGGATYSSAWSKSGQQHTSRSAAFTKVTLSLGSYGDTVRLKFKGTAGSSWTGDMALDDIAVFDSANCAPPHSLQAIISSTTATNLQWQDVSGASQWQVQYDSLGAPLTGAVTALQSTLSVNSLSPGTSYRFRVRAFCPGGDTTSWSAIKQFTMPCLPQVRTKNNAFVFLDNLGKATNIAAEVDSGSAVLTCAYDSLWTVPAQWTCSNLGSQSGTLYVVNRFGDTASRAFTARVIDTVAPTAAGLPANANLAFCNATFTYTAPIANDNCGGNATVTQTQGLPSGATFPNGTTVNSFRLTDAAGNSRTVSFTVTVGSGPSVLLPTKRHYCLNADTVNLGFNQNITYTGSGIVGTSSFVAAQAGVGVHLLIYSLPASGGCTFSDTLQLEVLPVPNPTIADIGNDILQTGLFNSYQWWRNGTTIPGATGQTLNYTQPGNYQVEVMDSLCSAFSAAFNIDSNDVSVGEFAMGSFKLYPNPGKDEVTVQWLAPLSTHEAELRWYNTQGKMVYKVAVPGGVRQLQMRVAHLPKGLYQLQWHSLRQSKTVGTWLKN